MITGLIIGASILASARIVARALTSRQGNPVTRQSRTKRVSRTWDSLANESHTIGDNDRTVALPTWSN